MATKMTFEGGKELERALAQLEKAATRKTTARRALKQAAEPIHSAYQANTIVATGALFDNEIIGTRLNRRQAGLNRRMGKAEVEIHVGTADPAGIQQEFGNVNQTAAPALRPAWDREGGARAMDRIGEFMWPEIEKAAARQAKRKAKG
jgi:hypothetical protein